jgi:hypothetical protein
MKSAYKQLGIHEDQLRFSIIAVFHLELQAWRFAISWALPFGLSGAVLHFNRVPAFIVAFCRRWLAIPIQNFYDDFRLVELAAGRDSGFQWFSRAAELLGWRFDPDKDQFMSEQLPMLGNIEDSSDCDRHDILKVHASKQRLEEMRGVVKAMLTAKRCTKSEAASLRGKLLNLASTRPARTGKGNHMALNLVADGIGIGVAVFLRRVVPEPL